MRIAISIRPDCGTSVRELLERRLGYALARHAGRLRSVTALLERGADSVGLAVIVVPRVGAPLHLREESRDPGLALDRAARRLQRALCLRYGAPADERSHLAS